jgi:hypothetical protein
MAEFRNPTRLVAICVCGHHLRQVLTEYLPHYNACGTDNHAQHKELPQRRVADAARSRLCRRRQDPPGDGLLIYQPIPGALAVLTAVMLQTGDWPAHPGLSRCTGALIPDDEATEDQRLRDKTDFFGHTLRNRADTRLDCAFGEEIAVDCIHTSPGPRTGRSPPNSPWTRTTPAGGGSPGRSLGSSRTSAWRPPASWRSTRFSRLRPRA